MSKVKEMGDFKEKEDKKIKCVIWDLDNTVWNGILIEDNNVTLRDGVVEVIKSLDSRGILQSIVSKNEETQAMEKLKEFGLEEYFIYPQINWNSKSSSIKIIVESINIGMDTIAFIDDQVFEREEVNYVLPQVLCIDAIDLNNILAMDEMNPRFITKDSKNRREMYRSDIKRNKLEKNFEGAQEGFLSTLGMELGIFSVGEDDLKRAEELTVRTHQLNTTGHTYCYEELDDFRKSEKHKLLIASLDDKYGSYGRIGLVLIECTESIWTIKLLLMSCRVMSRGVGTIIINHIMKLAKAEGVRLVAEFVVNERNKMMYITYKFAGFKEISDEDGNILLENNLSRIQDVPEYIKVNVAG